MIAIEHTDAVNSKILAVSEDRIQGFVREPFSEIARLSAVEETVVLHRIKAMLTAGTIRRVRQTLLATNLADGALVAWKVPDDSSQLAGSAARGTAPGLHRGQKVCTTRAMLVCSRATFRHTQSAW